MRKLLYLSGIAAIVLAVGATGASASPRPQAADTVLAGGQCTGSWVDTHDAVAARAEPNATSSIRFWVYNNETHPCRKLVVGGGYAACGYTGANGWILVQDMYRAVDHIEPGWSGYVPSVCTSDR